MMKHHSPPSSILTLARHSMRQFVSLLALLMSTASFAQGGLRPIPAEAKPAVLEVVGEGVVSLNGKNFRLSPAAQIRDAQNRLSLTQSMSGKYKVRAQLDNLGAVHRVWILTPEEAAQKPK